MVAEIIKVDNDIVVEKIITQEQDGTQKIRVNTYTRTMLVDMKARTVASLERIDLLTAKMNE